MPFGNTNYDTLQTTTLEKYAQKTLRDNIFDSSAFFRLIKERGGVTLEGGSVILEPILAGKTSATNVGSYSGYDTLPTDPQSGITAAQFSWKQLFASIIISGLEDDVQNTGEAAVIKLLKAKMMQAEESLISALNQQLYGDGTGNSGKNIVGLALAVSSTGTYGNINRSDSENAWWRSVEVAVGGPLVVEGGSTSLQRVYDLASQGGGRNAPDLGLTTRIIYEALESFFTPDRRYADGRLAQYGFEALRFRGNCDVTWDEDATSGVFYFLNTKTFKFVTHPARNFTVDGPKRPPTQDSKIWHILWAGALTCNECRRNGKLTGITNT
jgi:hypothetical protein